MSTVSRNAVVLALVSAVACGGAADPSSRINSFRTFAMRATRVVQSDTCDAGLVAAADARPGAPPKLGKTRCDVPGSYAHPGDEVQLELLWHPGPETSRSWMWTMCVNPPSTSVFGCFQKLARDIGKLPPEQRGPFLASTVRARPATVAKTFEQNELAADPASDPRTIFRVKVPEDVLKELDGAPPAAKRGASIGVIFFACPGRIEIDTSFGSGSLRNALPVQCLDNVTGEPLGSDKFTVGIKRLFLRTRDENADPRIASVLLNGQPWSETEEKQIKATCGADEARFEQCDDPKPEIKLQLAAPFEEKGTDEFGTPFEEQVVVQYYATEGLFEYDVKRAEDPGTRFSGRRVSTGPETMWIVIRDNRGGVSWVKRGFRVVPR